MDVKLGLVFRTVKIGSGRPEKTDSVTSMKFASSVTYEYIYNTNKSTVQGGHKTVKETIHEVT